MDIEISFLEDLTIATIKGRIVIGRDVDNAKKELIEIIDNCSKNIILDMSNVTFMDSSGLGALASLKIASDSKQKKIVLAGLSSQIKRMLEITGLSKIFEVYPVKEDAVVNLKHK